MRGSPAWRTGGRAGETRAVRDGLLSIGEAAFGQ